MKLFYGQFPFSWAVLMLMCTEEIGSEGISCFKCSVAPLPGASHIQKPSQICSQFDGSSLYQTYCPKSTLCMKRTIHHKLVNGTIVRTSVERDCAPQLDVFQSYDHSQRAWHSEEKIVRSAYEEGCVVGPDKGSPGGPPEYCYCQYPLCNHARTLNGQSYIIHFSFLMFICSIAFRVS
ncbi:uncharacterized protein LOC107041220 [Diachasma alloeum]|uniref:uncharacterized protein LOC107041220 n=1 Tax=Diachasma alloeum TaxID=454923 RepID=UPI00073815E3|nr:uncharacterized protein LOC107041220 [Diachasma alloeum]